jgi:hypothetical protein
VLVLAVVSWSISGVVQTTASFGRSKAVAPTYRVIQVPPNAYLQGKSWSRSTEPLEPHEREFTMAIEYKVRISEKQRKLIMRALTTTVANKRRSTSGEALNDDDWMELISVFAALDPRVLVADDQSARLPVNTFGENLQKEQLNE